MEEKNKSTLDYMMHYGALLGIFWIFKYSFFIGQSYWVHFIYFYHLFYVVSPLLMYIFYLKYKAETPELKHDIWRCVLFVLGICFFGSLFETVIIYAHYAYINPDFFVKMSSVYVGAVENMHDPKNLSADQVAALNESKNVLVTIFSSKPLYLILNIISQMTVGLLFSLLIGVLTRNRNTK